MKKIREILKENLDGEKEALAVADAMRILAARHGDENRLVYEFAEDLTFIMERENYVQKVINCFDDPFVRSVFGRRYIDKMRWEEVAELEYVSAEYLFKVHKKGINALESAGCLLSGF